MATSIKCAQRLTASEVWTLVFCPDQEQRISCSTPYGIRGLDTSNNRQGIRPFFLVLNALRHQRFGHENPPQEIEGRSGCSTPYGIRGLDTEQQPVKFFPPRCAQRLTASEVWTRGVHWGDGELLSGAQRLTASEVWTLPVTKVFICSGLDCAQRLTASEVWTRRPSKPLPEKDSWQVLQATWLLT